VIRPDGYRLIAVEAQALHAAVRPDPDPVGSLCRRGVWAERALLDNSESVSDRERMGFGLHQMMHVDQPMPETLVVAVHCPTGATRQERCSKEHL